MSSDSSKMNDNFSVGDTEGDVDMMEVGSFEESVKNIANEIMSAVPPKGTPKGTRKDETLSHIPRFCYRNFPTGRAAVPLPSAALHLS